MFGNNRRYDFATDPWHGWMVHRNLSRELVYLDDQLSRLHKCPEYTPADLERLRSTSTKSTWGAMTGIRG